VARLGEDWVFLALLGIIMALLSFIMDKGISICTNGNGAINRFPSSFLVPIVFLYVFYIPLARIWLYRDLTSQPFVQYIAWVSLPVCLILFSAGFVHLIAPQSIGKRLGNHTYIYYISDISLFLIIHISHTPRNNFLLPSLTYVIGSFLS